MSNKKKKNFQELLKNPEAQKAYEEFKMEYDLKQNQHEKISVVKFTG